MITLLLVAALSLPVQVQGDGFVVRAELGMDSLAQRVAGEVPGALAAIYEDLPDMRRREVIEIRLVKESASLQGAAPGGAGVPEWAAGVAFPRAGIIAVAARRGANPIDVSSTVTHELAHMALGAALDGRAPRWLDEGFAYLHSSDYSWARTRTLTGLAWSGDRYFFFELEDRFPPGENQAGRAYAQAYDFVSYLAKRGRYADDKDDGDREPFRRFLHELAIGRTLDGAALESYGVSFKTLEDEWWTRVRERYLWSLVGMFTLFVWVVGAILLTIGYWRKRRLSRRKLAEWDEEDAIREATL